jgi:fumarate reductase flavoprotein subunit
VVGTMTGHVDLLVVGGGLAGLTAGVRALDLGLSVAVLEQGRGADYGSNSRHSSGIVHLAFHDPYRPEDELLAVIDRISGGEADPDLARALARDGRRLLDWLQEKGGRFMRFNQQEGFRWCMAPPRSMKAGIDWHGRGPDLVLRGLAERLGDGLHLGTRVTALRMDQGRCVGAVSETDGAETVWSANFVLLADGGFQADRALYERHVGGAFDRIFQRGARTSHGAGLRMALEAGAATRGLDRFYGHILSRDALHDDGLWPYPQIDAVATAGIVVDESGRRVADEGRSGVFLTNALAAARGSASFHAVFDQAIWDGPGTSAWIPANPVLEQAGGAVLRAASLTELAAMIGAPADALRETVEAYNAALAAGRPDSLPVPRSSAIRPWPIAAGPFMAIPIVPGITYTMGGVAIDAKAQVLDESGRPIPGLLAAGASTGGLEGGSNAAYLGGLLKAGVFGLIAAETAREFSKGQRPVSPDGTGAAPQAIKVRYPVLRLVTRYGLRASIATGVAVGALTLLVGWPSLGVLAVPVALGAGGLTGVLGASYVELVRLVTGIFMPDQES